MSDKTLHTESQLLAKVSSLKKAVNIFIKEYENGFYDNEDFLFHGIESMLELVKEAKSAKKELYKLNYKTGDK